MFIKEILQHIWKVETEKFQMYTDKYMNVSVDHLIYRLRDVSATHFMAGHMHLSNLVTCGCPHYASNNLLGGCSMCNLHSSSLETTAMMRVLRDRAPQKYAEVVRNSFLNARGIVRKREIHEFLYSYAFTDRDEITDLCLELLLGENGVYEKKPIVMEFETTASSLVPERIRMLKKYLPRTKILIRIGVECGNEFIRTHWLNKNITNRHIINATENCKNEGVGIIGNVLFGIPGMTEKNNASIFKGTLLWLDKLKFDGFSCSVLDRRNHTLQWFLHEYLEYDDKLCNFGISNGFHTGLPWLFTYFSALSQMEEDIEGFYKKLIFSQFNESYIDGSHTMSFNADANCECRMKANEVFSTKSRTDFNYSQFYHNYMNDLCYKSYVAILSKQDNVKSIKENLQILGERISKILWEKSESKNRYSMFLDELEHYTDTEVSNEKKAG